MAIDIIIKAPHLIPADTQLRGVTLGSEGHAIYIRGDGRVEPRCRRPALRTDAIDFHVGQELTRQIVERFNAHAALIEAAEAVLPYLDRFVKENGIAGYGDIIPPNELDDVNRNTNNLKAAIAEAKGE